MSSQIIAGTTSGTALNMSADTSGILEIKTGSGPTTAITVDGSQNVGIGTTSPTNSANYKTLSLNGTTGGQLAFQSGGTLNGSIYNDASGNFIYSPYGYAAFWAAGAERMRIDTSGNLLVGRTTTIGIATGLIIDGTANRGLTIGSSTYRTCYMDTVNSIMYWYNGTNQASLTAAGAWTNASDARLKNNITDIKYGLNTVLATQPRSYKMNNIDGDYIGFVAQEMQKVIPEVVSGDEKQLGIDYGSLVAVAFKAIQEQQVIIQELKAEVDALKGNK